MSVPSTGGAVGSSGHHGEWGSATRCLAEHGLEALGTIGERELWAQDAPLYRQGERSRRFRVVVRGRLQASFLTRQGQRLIVGLYGRGDVAGFAGALSQKPRRASVHAVEPSECLAVGIDQLLELWVREPHQAGVLLPVLSRNLVGCANCLVESVCNPVEARIACLFLHLLEEVDGDRAGRGWIPMRLSRRELAELTGTTVETCSRVMSRWRRRGIVLTSDDGFWVQNQVALNEIASH